MPLPAVWLNGHFVSFDMLFLLVLLVGPHVPGAVRGALRGDETEQAVPPVVLRDVVRGLRPAFPLRRAAGALGEAAAGGRRAGEAGGSACIGHAMLPHGSTTVNRENTRPVRRHSSAIHTVRQVRERNRTQAANRRPGAMYDHVTRRDVPLRVLQYRPHHDILL